MNYKKATTILPDPLLKEIQKYVQGELLYIPKPAGERRKWGEASGNRAWLCSRNAEICSRYRSGQTMASLAEEYYLSLDSIRKIIYTEVDMHA